MSLLLARPEIEANTQDCDGNSALLHACKRGHQNVVELLLQSGRCDKNVQNKFGQTPLHDAAKSGHIGVVAALLFQGMDPNVQDKWSNSALMYATLHGHSSVVALLISSGCDVNFVNRGCRTALHTASLNGHTKIVNSLIEAGAILDVPDMDDHTPAHLSARYKHYEITRLLIQAGCDVHATEKHRKNLMHFCAYHGYKDLVQMLIDRCLHPDIPDAVGNTPLTAAVRRNHLDVIKLLLWKNCSVNRMCVIAGIDHSLLNVVLMNGQSELAYLLIQCGCDISCIDAMMYAKTVAQVIVDDKEFYMWLKQLPRQPVGLQQVCRLVLRRCFSYDIEVEISVLDIPVKLRDYILMKDVLLS